RDDAEARAPLPEGPGLETEPVLEALLQGGLDVSLPVRGDSMRPTLVPGDRIVVAPCLGLPRPGEILVRRAAAGIMAHRLVTVALEEGRRLYRTQGDNEPGLDEGCRREELLGRVVAVIRDGRTLPIDDSAAARRRALFRLAIRRRRPRLLRRAAVLATLALLGGGAVSAARAEVGPFAQAATTFAPAPDYRFAPGDVLSLRIWDGERIDEQQLTVQSDGTAFLPILGLGSIEVGGKTAIDAKKEIEGRLSRIYKEIYTELLVLRYAGHRVHLMGEVRTTARTDSGPGDWALSGPTRLVSFLAEHGGPSPEADLMRVQVARRDGSTQDVNLFKAVFHHSEEDNPTLQDGDFVFVPSMQMGLRKVYVLGEVNQPGVVTIYDRMTLIEAVARAGGLSLRSNPKEVVLIKRRPDGKPDLRAANLKELFKTGDLKDDFEVEPGDIVYVSKGFLAHLHDVFSIIAPALDTIESLYIIDDFKNGD
ncbi:MAG TPA: SLBB domain-containing protein, partial [Candidatus Polarisedimenticolia bacterium]|nr:SLBB domain-containing protein [Candidatus Polarisedimenticolia bacterium]